MLSDYFGCFVPPNQLAVNKDWYTADGLVIWPKFKFAKMVFVEREKGRNDAHIREALKDPNKAVMLQVDNGAHWVVAIGKTLWGNDYRIVDPWFGDKRTACGTYKNITGAAYWKRA